MCIGMWPLFVPLTSDMETVFPRRREDRSLLALLTYLRCAWQFVFKLYRLLPLCLFVILNNCIQLCLFHIVLRLWVWVWVTSVLNVSLNLSLFVIARDHFLWLSLLLLWYCDWCFSAYWSLHRSLFAWAFGWFNILLRQWLLFCWWVFLWDDFLPHVL